MPDYGNDFATATIIDNASLVNGELHAGNTEDWFRVVLPTGLSYFTIKILEKSSSGVVTVYDSSETELEWSTSQITLTEPADGEYFIKYTDSTYGPYTLGTYPTSDSQTTPFHDSIFSKYDIIPQDNGGEINIMVKTILSIEESGNMITSPNINAWENQFGINTLMHLGVNGNKVPSEFFKPKVIMVGHKPGVSRQMLLSYEDKQRYVIKGTVKMSGVVQIGKLLRLYDRKTGQMMDQTYSDENGEYEFKSPLHSDHKYYVIAFDDMDAPELQAVVHDALIPIEKV